MCTGRTLPCGPGNKAPRLSGPGPNQAPSYQLQQVCEHPIAAVPNATEYETRDSKHFHPDTTLARHAVAIHAVGAATQWV